MIGAARADGPQATELSFVITDVVDSSLRWAFDPEQMRDTMIRHNVVIEDVVVRLRGMMLDGEGDSRAALFESPLDAVLAAGHAQADLMADRTVRVRVRIGVHTGEVYRLREGEFGGSPLNYLGRMHKAAHGGQILVSETTAALVAGRLPPGWTLTDIGVHAFRDFAARRIFQLHVPGLPDTFGPLGSEARYPLPPRSHRPLLGRDAELASFSTHLPSRVTTLVGPAGVGKTRLAHELAYRLLPRFSDGVCYVPLNGVDHDDLVADAVAAAVRANPQLEATVTASLARSLGSKQLLVVLDNCEHVLHGAGEVASVLAGTYGTEVLATSRVPLAVTGEIAVSVRPLSVPLPGAGLDRLRESPAVRLFVERAAGPAALTEPADEMLAEAVEVCRRMGGIPLDIELAAGVVATLPARTRPRTVGLADLVAERVGRDPPVNDDRRSFHNRTIDQLTPVELAILQRVAVFPGGAPYDLLSEMAAPAGAWSGDDWVLSSAVQSLSDRAVAWLEPAGSVTLVRTPEPLRQAVLDALGPAARQQLDAAHRRVVLDRAMGAGELVRGPGEADVVPLLGALDSSLRLAVHGAGDADQAADVLESLHEYSLMRLRQELYQWVDYFLARDDLNDRQRGRLEGLAAIGTFNRGDVRRAEQLSRSSLARAEVSGVEPSIYAYGALISALGFQGKMPEAEAYYFAAHAWCSAPGRTYFHVNSLVLASMGLIVGGQIELAQTLAEQALASAESLGNPSSLAWALCALGEAERTRSPGGAHVRLDEALDVCRSVGNRWVEGQILLNLTLLRLSASVEDSTISLIDTLAMVESTGNPNHRRQALRLAFVLLAGWGRREDAALLASVATDAVTLPPPPDLRARMEATMAALERNLGSEMFTALRDRGRRMAEPTLVSRTRRTLIDVIGLPGLPVDAFPTWSRREPDDDHSLPPGVSGTL